MGYSFTIGQLVIEKQEENGLDSDCINFSAESKTLDYAPAFGEPTDFSNTRWPSYSAWTDFTKDAGLYHIFYDHYDKKLIGGHPGVRLVTKELCDVVQEALIKRRTDYPNSVEQFEGENSDGVLCRLIWLDFWLRWAFENCETPVLANI